jgi:uncharacterized protein (TIGR02145 family)
MNKPLFLTAVLLILLQITSFGQSIKLNNEGDPGSAMLEVNSASKGILIPNVTLTGITDAITIALPAASLLVYNTATVSDVEPGYYYNSGTAVSPFWTRLSTGTSPGTAGDGSETKVTAGTNVTVTGSGTSASPYIVNASEVDGDVTNEIQDLSISENALKITLNGAATSIDLSSYLDNTDDQTLAEILTSNTSAGSKQITSLADPVSAQDAATKKYVDDNDDVGDGSETKVTAGTNVTVTGIGTSGSPYLVDAAGGDGSETKVTAGTNVTVTGIGTSGSPYIVGAVSGDGSETKVTAGTNVTVTGIGTSGSPYLVDAAGGDGSETKVTAGTNVTVTGSGTSGSPYIVGAVSGDGSETKVTAGTNVTVTGSGTSGSPYIVGAAGGDGSETKVTAGTNVTVTGSGTSASPYIVDATEVDGDVTNELQNLTQVLTKSNDAGNLAITNLANPIAATDAATKAYVDLLESKLEALEGVKDIDNNRYDIIKIGTQTWMAENLKTTRYNDGSVIPLITDGTAWVDSANNNAAAYCWYNAPNETSNLIAYGALYNWYAINSATNGNKNVCPVGWHVPIDGEWTTLSTYLGGEGVAGGKMKEAGLAHWNTPNGGATNESGFSGLPGGYRYYDGAFDVGGDGNWWSSTEYNTADAWSRILIAFNGNVYRYGISKGSGFSVRCLRD